MKFLLLPDIQPWEAVKLGCLVTNPKQPHIDICPVNLGISSDAVTTSFESLTGVLSASKSRKFTTSLTTLLKIHLQPGEQAQTAVSSRLVKRYEITDQRATFAAICREPDAQAWLEEGIKYGDPAFLVVGAMTITDGHFIQQKNRDKKLGADLSAPVGAALAGGADPTGGILDPGIGVEWSRKNEEHMIFTAPGEMVWAVACRKIKFESFKRKAPSTAMLDRVVHWTPLSTQRTASVEGAEEIAASLENEEIAKDASTDELAILSDGITTLISEDLELNSDA